MTNNRKASASVFEREAKISRLHDALRMLPFVAVLLFASPLVDHLPAIIGETQSDTARFWGIFVFWAALIAIIALVNMRLARRLQERGE